MREMMPALGWLITIFASAAALVSERSGGSGQAGNEKAARKNAEAAVQVTNRFGLSSPLPRHPGAIRIATYNMLNFFDGVDDPNLQGEFDDIRFTTAPARCAKLAEAIKATDADIIALQEVESLEALTWFRDTYLKDSGYKYLASIDVGYYRGVECSVMSRFKITDAKVWLNESLDNVKRDGPGWAPVPPGTHFVFQRSPLMVDVLTDDGYRLTVFSIHHKAGGAEFRGHREAESLRLVELIEQMEQSDPSRNIAVMGDFNSAPWDKSVRTYLKAGFVDTLDFRSTGKEDADAALFKTHESDRILDFILLNAAAFHEYVPGSGFVLGTVTPPPGYDYQKDPQPPGYASDHYPVVIDLIPKDGR